jgi:HPt (histidine-containing phosphotransfer) domain-containing protein
MAENHSGADRVMGISRPQEALARLGGLLDIYMDVVTRFLDDSTASLERINSLAAAQQFDKLHRAAHSLKGVAAMCGAESVAEVSAAIDETARASRADDLPQLLRRLEGELAAAQKSLAPYRNSGA